MSLPIYSDIDFFGKSIDAKSTLKIVSNIGIQLQYFDKINNKPLRYTALDKNGFQVIDTRTSLSDSLKAGLLNATLILDNPDNKKKSTLTADSLKFNDKENNTDVTITSNNGTLLINSTLRPAEDNSTEEKPRSGYYCLGSAKSEFDAIYVNDIYSKSMSSTTVSLKIGYGLTNYVEKEVIFYKIRVGSCIIYFNTLPMPNEKQLVGTIYTITLEKQYKYGSITPSFAIHGDTSSIPTESVRSITNNQNNTVSFVPWSNKMSTIRSISITILTWISAEL